jgi:peptidoglycan/xylan/chitin deacetylase (PgdA/CDA1 family)
MSPLIKYPLEDGNDFDAYMMEVYYQLKPVIPKRLQINLRRKIVSRKRKKYAEVWPIDEKAKKPPDGWTGWPDNKKFALVLTHDVETSDGLRKCEQIIKIEENLGFRSSFNFLAKQYYLPMDLIDTLKNHGYEVGLHGLTHEGNIFRSRGRFNKQAPEINRYLGKWSAVGFRCPSMYHNLEWISDLNIEYDSSTFDTDPFEPQPDGVGTIFPFSVKNDSNGRGYVELPYTLPQDHCLFIIMQEKDISIWRKKLDWIARNGGMALLITHPDYMSFDGKKGGLKEYPVEYYEEFLEYIKGRYKNQYWNVLPKEIARFWAKEMNRFKPG